MSDKITRKCQGCGGGLVFNSTSQQLRCESCGQEYAVEKSSKMIMELDYRAALKNLSNEQTIEQTVVKCPSCAAEIVFPDSKIAGECPFCATNLVGHAESMRMIKPHGILPFAIEKANAESNFKHWLSKRWFAPNDLKKQAKSDKLQGMYLPYWTFDTDTYTEYTGERGEHYYTTEHYTVRVNGKTERRTRRVQHTRWWNASGSVYNSFDDILIPASESVVMEYANKLEPWDLDKLESFTTDYVFGYEMEKYKIDLPSAFSFAETKMEPAIETEIRHDIGGDVQRISSYDISYSNTTYKHILLPTWISSYRYKEKVYQFLVNARTGEVQGGRPWSWIKITAASILTLAAIGAGVFLLYNNFFIS
ncbi:MAG: hypothetical protein JXR63_12685 [Spirochaetales bacterium]|nr:hypothetical protein [Spirochaetales bacterium]